MEEENKISTRPKPTKNDAGGMVGFYDIKPHAQEQIEKPSFVDTFKAQVRADNTIINNAFKVTNELQTLSEYFDKDYEEGFNPTDKNLLAQADPLDWPKLVLSRTPKEFYRRLARIEQENKARSIANDGTLGGNLVGGLFNGVTDPLTLIPVANGLRRASLLTGFVDGFSKTIPGTLAAASLSEANLQWAKETQTFQESAMNTLTQTLMGGLIGGGIGLKRSLSANAYKKLIQDTVKGQEVKFSLGKNGEVNGFKIFDDSAGAASVKQVWFEDNQIYGFTKDGKLSVARPFFFMAGKFAKNPVVQGLMSPSPTMAKFTTDMYEHNFDIVGSVLKDKYKPQSLQTKLREYESLQMRADLEVANSYFDYLGLPKDATTLNTIKSKLKEFPGKLRWKDYTLELNLAISRGGVHADAGVAKAARNIYKQFYEPLQAQLEELKILAPNVKPFGAAQYLNRLYDREYIVANKPLVQEFLSGKFAQTNDKVKAATAQITNLEELIDSQQRLISDLPIEDLPRAQVQLKQYQVMLAREKKKLRNKLRQGKFSPDMLVGKAGMSFNEVKQLKALRKPIMQKRKTIKQLEQELTVHKRSINPDRLPGEKNAPADEKQLALEAKILQEKEALKELRAQVQAKYEAGQIPDNFAFTTKTGEVRLRKPNRGTLKLRPILNDDEINEAATNALENMIGLNDFQVTQGIMDGLVDGSIGSNPLKPRSLLISDEELYKNKLLISDTRKNIRAYIGRMGRIIEMQKYLKNNGYDGQKAPIEWLTNNIKQDYAKLERALTKNFADKKANIQDPKKLDALSKEEQKARIKLDKDMRRDINLASVTYTRITGGYNYNPKEAGLLRTSRFLNNWAYGTQLGALVFMGLQDAVSPIFRNGVLPHIKGGVLPFIRNITKGDWKANAALKEQAAHLGIGIEYDKALLDISFQTGQDFELPLNFIERQAGNAASAMGITNLSNIWADKCNRIAATASISKILTNAPKFLDGSISKGNKLDLARLGLNNERILKKIVEMDKQFGQSLSGARLANLNDWTDFEVAEIFKNAVRQDVRSVIFSGKNIATYPTTFENPNSMASTFLLYMGWMFNATANYTLPLLQRFDPNKIVGVTMMLAAGMLVDPLRKISRGEDVEDEPFTLFKKGVLNSGVGGVFVDVFNRANAVGDIVPSLQVDRYKGKGFELAFGPLGTLTDIGLNFVGQAANREWNRSDLKKLKRAIPLVETFYFRKFTNDFIDSLGLPKNRRAARRQNE